MAGKKTGNLFSDSITVGNRTFDDVEALETLVISAATQYDTDGYAEDDQGVEISDPEYDALYKELKSLKPTSKAFKGTSPSEAKTVGSVIKHDPPMTSINKSDGDENEKKAIYQNWVVDCAKRLGKQVDEIDIVQTYKRDGVALRVNYLKGKLVSAGLRPRDGVNGTDVTHHMKYIKGVPQELPLPLTLSLNGEIECWHSDFAVVNAAQEAAGNDVYKNPRNFTAGCMGRDDAEENKNSLLRIAFYSITGFDDSGKYYKTEIERAKWANSPEGLNLQDSEGKGYFVQVRAHEFKHLKMMEDHAPKLPYYTDGVVLKVDNLEWQEELGHTGDDAVNPPRGALAWKFKEEEAEAEIACLEWNASRTGRVVPKAIFVKSVRLADTDVIQATVNNYGWATERGIGKGTIVKVKKAGKIIPNVCGVVSGEVKDIGAPTKCPTCDSTLKLVTSSSGSTDLICQNMDCAAKQIQSWIFFINKIGGKGLGASTMEKILDTGKVKVLPDLYDLTVKDLMDGDFTERQALLALATIFGLNPDKDDAKLTKAIETARTSTTEIEAWKFFASLGIPSAGETAGKALVAHYKDFDKIRNASVAELQTIAGIGQKTAEAITGWFKYYSPVVDRLLQRVTLLLPKTGVLTGNNFCLTGSFDQGKKHWQTLIENSGGNIQSSVGKTTHYLIQQHGKNDGSPSEKEVKAVKLGVPVISVADLERML